MMALRAGGAPSGGWRRAAAAACLPTSPYSSVVAETVKLDYIEEASGGDRGAPVVILHGLLGSKQNWRNMLRLLARTLERRIYALDLRNHGTSPHASPMTYEAMANDVDRFLREKQLPPVVLVGHSMVRTLFAE